MATKYVCDNCGHESRDKLPGLGIYSSDDIIRLGYYGGVASQTFATAQSNVAMGTHQPQSLVPVKELCDLCVKAMTQGMAGGLAKAKETNVIRRAAGG